MNNSNDRAEAYMRKAGQRQPLHGKVVVMRSNDLDRKAEVNRMTPRSRCSAPQAESLTLGPRSEARALFSLLPDGDSIKQGYCTEPPGDAMVDTGRSKR